MFMDNDGATLASEILHELKLSARRWFIAFIIMLCVEIATVVGFLWYLSLPAEELLITNDEGNANYIGRDLTGEIYTGDNSYNSESSAE